MTESLFTRITSKVRSQWLIVRQRNFLKKNHRQPKVPGWPWIFSWRQRSPAIPKPSMRQSVTCFSISKQSAYAYYLSSFEKGSQKLTETLKTQAIRPIWETRSLPSLLPHHPSHRPGKEPRITERLGSSSTGLFARGQGRGR